MPRVKTDHGVTLYYETIGEGPPMIFHGHHHRIGMYTQVPFFSPYFQVIAYDRRGCGRSEDVAGEWTPEDFSRDCAGLMDALGLERAIVSGTSTGGMLSMQFGLDYPDRTVAIAASALPCWPWEQLDEHHLDPALKALDEATDEAEFDLLGLLARTPVPSFRWESDPPVLISPEFEASETMRLLVESGAWDLGTSREALQKILAITGTWDLRTSSKTTKLEELQVPTLIIVGQLEPPRLIGQAWEMYRMLPNAEFAMLPGLHGDTALLWPSKYNMEIRNFLDRHGLLPAPAEPPAVGQKATARAT